MNWKLQLMVALMFAIINCTTFASPILSKNSSGDSVIALQKKLYMIGYKITEIDGIYGDETEHAVKSFQKEHKISVTGIVNNATWRALRNTKDKKGLVLPAVKKSSAKVSTIKTPSLSSYNKISITSAQAKKIIATARNFIGVPYVFGGTTPKGFDCSGLLQYVFKKNGISIPRLADEQYFLGKSAKRNQLHSGDLVFFTTYTKGVSHCGIYVGNGNFIHASSSKGVRIDSLDNTYWNPRFVGARKIVK